MPTIRIAPATAERRRQRQRGGRPTSRASRVPDSSCATIPGYSLTTPLYTSRNSPAATPSRLKVCGRTRTRSTGGRLTAVEFNSDPLSGRTAARRPWSVRASGANRPHAGSRSSTPSRAAPRLPREVVQWLPNMACGPIWDGSTHLRSGNLKAGLGDGLEEGRRDARREGMWFHEAKSCIAEGRGSCAVRTRAEKEVDLSGR